MDPNSQILLSVGISTIAVLVGILVNNRQIDALRAQVDTQFNALQQIINARFAAVDERFNAAHQALLRFEGVLDARLRSLEDERRP